MTDLTIVNHESRLTELALTMSSVLARLERLEQAQARAAAEKQQAEQRETIRIKDEELERTRKALQKLQEDKAKLEIEIGASTGAPPEPEATG